MACLKEASGLTVARDLYGWTAGVRPFFYQPYVRASGPYEPYKPINPVRGSAPTIRRIWRAMLEVDKPG